MPGIVARAEGASVRQRRELLQSGGEVSDMPARLIESRALTPEERWEWEREQADLEWWKAHYAELLREHAGKYAVVLDGRAIPGDSPREVFAEADKIAPGRMPCLHHLSNAEGVRLYGGLRVVGADGPRSR